MKCIAAFVSEEWQCLRVHSALPRLCPGKAGLLRKSAPIPSEMSGMEFQTVSRLMDACLHCPTCDKLSLKLPRPPRFASTLPCIAS